MNKFQNDQKQKYSFQIVNKSKMDVIEVCQRFSIKTARMTRILIFPNNHPQECKNCQTVLIRFEYIIFAPAQLQPGENVKNK